MDTPLYQLSGTPLSLTTDAALSTNPTGNAAGVQETAQTSAKEFEAVFLSVMLNQMFSGVKTDGPFGGGQGEEMFRSLLIEEYGSEIAARGGLGLADHVARELIALQEADDAI